MQEIDNAQMYNYLYLKFVRIMYDSTLYDSICHGCLNVTRPDPTDLYDSCMIRCQLGSQGGWRLQVYKSNLSIRRAKLL